MEVNRSAGPYLMEPWRAGKSRGSTGRPLARRRVLTRVLKGLLVVVLLVTIAINVMFILDTSHRLQEEAAHTGEGGEMVDGESRRNSLRLQELIQPKSLAIEVYSSPSKVSISVDGTTILEESDKEVGRGIHVLVLHQGTGSVMARRVFDTYTAREDEAMTLFLSMVSDRRLIVFAIKDEGTFQMKQAARDLLKRMGSKRAQAIGWRDMWAMATQKGVRMFGEAYSKSGSFSTWGAPVVLRAEVPLSAATDSDCDWPDSEESRRRREFCGHIEGYGSVCSCAAPAPIIFNPEPIPNNRVHDVPVVIIASNRPHYLYRMLRSVLSANGANPDMVTVFIDGYFDEPLAVSKLFGLRGIHHTPLSSKNGRITQHYKASLTATFSIHPDATYAIVIEEDLDVSPDFFSYFSQTVHLLEEDDSVYCVSAWNDLAYEHTSEDASMLYRVETMPGLGWILKKSMYKDELESRWPSPEKMWDWDMWMRMDEIRKDRECIIPDVSRTYHFGLTGVNMNSHFHDTYFKKHPYNTQPNVELANVDSMKKINYEELIENKIRNGTVLDHSKSPCDEDFIPETKGKILIMFIKMDKPDNFNNWLQVSKCFKIWDLDARGFHKSMWRMHMKSNELIIIGVPVSAYAKYMPSHITPICLESNNNKQSNKTR